MMAVESAHQNVGASSAELRISINDLGVELEIASRQLNAKIHAGGKIRRESGIKAFNTNVAKLIPLNGNDLPRIGFCREQAKIIRHLNLDAPARIEQVL